jgi:hypothetical protein
MQVVRDKTCGEQHAITDVYCEKRHRSLVKFPVALIGLLIGVGVAAFLLTGFVGYFTCTVVIAQNQCLGSPGNPDFWYSLPYVHLKEPWPLYLWASAVMIAIQVAILRHKDLRGYLIKALIAMFASILVVGLVYLFGADFVKWLQETYPKLLGIVRVPLTYAVLNLAIIVLFFAGSVIRWFNHPDGHALIGMRPALPRRRDDPDEASLEELISGDLLTGVVLFFVCAYLFTYDRINALTQSALGRYLVPAQVDCAGHTPPCVVPSHIADLHFAGGYFSLATLDNVLALLCLFMGFMTLAITAMLAGLAVLQGQVDPAGSKISANVTTEVAQTVLNALRAAITRQLRGLVRRIGYTLQRAVWPLLLLGSSFALALFGRYTLYYLHHTDPTSHCAPGYAAAFHLAACHPASSEPYLLFALAFGLGGVLGTVVSTALLVRSWRVVVNTLGLLRYEGLAVLLTFWIFALSLFGFNVLLLQLGVVPASLVSPTAACPAPTWYSLFVPAQWPCAQPFVPLSIPSAVSLAALLITGVVVLFRYRGHFARARSAGSTMRGRVPGARASAVPERGR